MSRKGLKGWEGTLSREFGRTPFASPDCSKDMTDGLVRAIGRRRSNHDVQVSFRGQPESCRRRFLAVPRRRRPTSDVPLDCRPLPTRCGRRCCMEGGIQSYLSMAFLMSCRYFLYSSSIRNGVSKSQLRMWREKEQNKVRVDGQLWYNRSRDDANNAVS